MFNVNTIQFIITLITLLLIYLVTVSLAGLTRAWVAKQMGDDGPEEAGFLTLNPVPHVDPVGLLITFLSYAMEWGLFGVFGWGTYFPIDTDAIHGRLRSVKVALALFSDTLCHMACAITGLVTIVGIFGEKAVRLTVDHAALTQQLSHLSSLTVTVTFIGVVFIYFNIMLAGLSFIINAYRTLMKYLFENHPELFEYHGFLTFALLLLFIFFFAAPMRLLIVHLILKGASIIAYLLGLGH